MMLTKSELERYQEIRTSLQEMSKIMRCSVEELPKKVATLIEDTENLKNERDELLRKLGRL